MGKRSFPELFSAAVERRTELLGRFAAVRLVDGIGDDIPDLYIDRFGDCAVAHFHGDSHAGDYRQELSQIPIWSSLGITTVFYRHRFKQSARSAEVPAEIIFGRWGGARQIKEHGVRYLIDPERHINAGFFIDMRDLRLRLQQISAGRRLLNLFCYSGSLGLSALSGGAAEVVQVDISKGILAWARENQALNAPVPGSMRIIPEDSLLFMEREARRVEKGSALYDVIVIDPPSFSRSSQGTFQIERDIGVLVERALPLLAAGGELVLTTNYSLFSAEDVTEHISEITRKSGRHDLGKTLLMPPVDFPSVGAASIASRGAIVKIR